VPQARILVVNDQASLRNLVAAYLRQEGYQVHTVPHGPGGLKAMRTIKPDLVVLDILQPGLNGIELLRQLRRESDVYVILLTSRSDEVDQVVGLWMGADDYLSRPFSPRELLARIKAALRRLKPGIDAAEPTVLAFQHIRIHLGQRLVWVDDQLVKLTSTEFDLLQTLARHPGLVLSREQLLEQVWGHDFYGQERVVDVHIGHIRQKLGSERFIVTVRGVGYRFEDETG
jgi:two-component system alkaline phosphatase synthesis response regulator PhoP